jgi:hypothetical protein
MLLYIHQRKTIILFFFFWKETLLLFLYNLNAFKIYICKNQKIYVKEYNGVQ